MEWRSNKQKRWNKKTWGMIWYDNVMLNELIQRHAYHSNSNTIPLTPRQVKTRQDKTRRNIHRFVAYNDNSNDNNNDNNNDNHYSMNSDGMKIIS